MHKPSIAAIVYGRLYPKPKPNDPVSFQAHITRNLVPEVREETARFYGPLESLESQYPGLDYTKSAHRNRLVLFTWHRRLFRAFDELRLTASEIEQLCRWEGTLWARQRYERENHTVIRNTIFDEVLYLEEEAATAEPTPLPGTTFQELEDENADKGKAPMLRGGQGIEDLCKKILEEEDENGDVRAQSYGEALNQQLFERVEARARGEQGVVMDEQFEQWMKEAAERNEDPSSFAASEFTASGSSHDEEDHTEYGLRIPSIFTPHPTLQGLTSPPRYTDYVPGPAPSTAPATGTAS